MTKTVAASVTTARSARRNATAKDDPGVAPCLADQLRLVYDPAARDFRDVPGVQTRVLGRFGSTTSFLADTEANK